MTTETPDTLLRQGIAAAKAGHKEEAIRLLMQVVEREERSEQAWLWLSQVVDSAEEKAVCLENVLAINPSNKNAHAGLAWLAQQGVTAPQDELAPAATGDEELCPRCGGVVSLAQNECPHCGLPMVVVCPGCRNHVTIEQPSCPLCQYELGDFRAGADYFLGLAQAYAEHSRPDLVPQPLAQARAEAAKDPEALERVGDLYARIGDVEAAISVVKEAADAAPDDGALQARLGTLYHRLGQPDQARAAYQRAIELADDPTALLELARLEIYEGHAAEARDLLKQVVRIKPLDAEAYLLLGDVERQLGREEEAVRQYERASQLTGRETAVGRAVLSRLIEVEGQAEAAARADWVRRQRATGPSARSRETERPGCVTIYAVLLGLSAVLGLCGMGSLLAGIGNLPDLALLGQAGLDLETLQLADMLPLWIGAGLVSAGIQGGLAFGLWRMKNWARIVLIVLHIIALVGLLINTAIAFLALSDLGLQSSLPTSLALGGIPLAAVALEGYIIFWFLRNRSRFS